MRVAAVRLAAAAGGLDGDFLQRADGAVDVHEAQLAAQVEASHVRLVDAFRGLGQGLHPRCELVGIVPERFPLDLAGLGREGAGLYRTRVDVGPYERGGIVHQKPLPWMRRGRWRFGHRHCRPNPRICMQEGSNFLCPAHIVFWARSAFKVRKEFYAGVVSCWGVSEQVLFRKCEAKLQLI